MKKLLLISLSFTCIKFSFSQPVYTFEIDSNASYTELANRNPLWVDRSWTYLNNSVPILTPIGFNFKFMNLSIQILLYVIMELLLSEGQI
jgi:hypothetical protein